MTYRFRGMIRHLIVGVMALAIAQNLLAAAMFSCGCPCCKTNSTGVATCSYQRAVSMPSGCCHAKKASPCCAQSPNDATPQDASPFALFSKPLCKCSLHSAPAVPEAIKDSPTSSAKSLSATTVGWLVPFDVVIAPPNETYYYDPPPDPGPSLQRLLCVWRK
jgi:hypothetical protein